jgi:LPS sulfotransferase NodH
MYALGVAARWIQPQARFVIVTPGRAGSELLTDLLNSHPDIVCEAEILRERMLWPERFVAGRSTKAGLAGARAFGLKIHCGHFGYQVLRERPDYLRELSESGVRLIFLRRDNLLAQAISSTVARRTRWHWRGADRPEFTALGVDPVEVLMMAYLFEESDQFLQAALDGLPHLTLTYEQDLLDASAQQATVDRICRHLGLPSAPTSSDHVRFTPKRLSDTVANFDAVAAVVAPTRFGRFLDDEPGPSAGPEVGLADEGVVPQLVAGAGEHDPAGLDDVGPVGQLEGPASVLLDQQDGDAGLTDGGDQGEHLLGHLGRQPEGGFVEQ